MFWNKKKTKKQANWYFNSQAFCSHTHTEKRKSEIITQHTNTNTNTRPHLHNDVCHTVAHSGRRPRVSLPHALGELHVRLLARVVLLGFAEGLGDHQLRNVDAVAQQVRNDLFGVVHGGIDVAVNQQLDGV